MADFDGGSDSATVLGQSDGIDDLSAREVETPRKQTPVVAALDSSIEAESNTDEPTPQAAAVSTPPMPGNTVAEPRDPFSTEEIASDDQPLESAEDLTNSPEKISTVSAETKLSIWKMSSDWSMAVALQAKGKELDHFGVWSDRAREEAQSLELELPTLPAHDDGMDRLQKNLAFLLDEAGPKLALQLREQFGAEAAALAELATKTNVLLLSYRPSWARLDLVVGSIRRAAENSGLPEAVWSDLVTLLEDRAAFRQVKSAIFSLHEQAERQLSRAAE